MILGYDVFHETPGTVDERRCKVCGAVCDVTRNYMGATSWAESMAKKKHLHDRFVCPNTGADWHERAYRLVERIEESPSETVAGLMRQDLDKLLAQHGCKL